MKTIITILAENDNPIDKTVGIENYEEAARLGWQTILDMFTSMPGSMDKADVLKVEVSE